MRLVLACLWLFLLLTVAVEAETRTFIVDNDDGYGVDRCLATGASCGAAVASAYCRSQAFADARSFRKVVRPRGYCSTQSAHRCGGSDPHGMIGTLEVEFLGEPSISLSE